MPISLPLTCTAVSAYTSHSILKIVLFTLLLHLVMELTGIALAPNIGMAMSIPIICTLNNISNLKQAIKQLQKEIKPQMLTDADIANIEAFAALVRDGADLVDGDREAQRDFFSNLVYKHPSSLKMTIIGLILAVF